MMITNRAVPAAGTVVRTARLAAGLTLAEMGQRCGYSASQISRYERGVQPLTDIRLLRQFASALGIPPHVLGLAPAGEPRHAGAGARDPGAGGYGPRVSGRFDAGDGDDQVLRREVLASAAGLVAAAALSRPAQRLPHAGSRLAGSLYELPDAPPVPLSMLTAQVARARACFQTARYDQLAAGLPGLIAAAAGTRAGLTGAARATASTQLAEAYIVAAGYVTKLNDDAFAWTVADRALQAAKEGDDALTLADARRAVATVLRRTGHAVHARGMLLAALQDIEPGAAASPAQVSVYGNLLQVAAYTAAVDGNRPAARELITEAREAANRLGGNANHRHTAFGPANVTLYEVSIAQVLGDNGTAIECARTLRPATIPTAERQGRYWIDVARAYHQWGKAPECYRALLSAEMAAPGEVRYRPPVHRMAEDLLRARESRSLPGLAAFTQRIGSPAG